MKIAVTTGVLGVPPSYFVVDAAQRIQAEHDFRVFALAARVRDDAVTIPIHDFVRPRSLPFGTRSAIGPLVTKRMTGAVRRYAPDLVHQHFATWSGSAVTMANSGIPLITTVHGYDVFLGLTGGTSAFDRLRVRQIRQTQHASDRVLAVSEYLAGRAVAAGFAADRLHVHYQGVDTDYYVPGQSVPVDDLPVLAFVGALTELKGVRDAIAASISLHKTVEHRLEIIGAGPLEAEVHAAAASNPHIAYRGPLTRGQVRVALQSSAVLVLPTQESGGRREAAGLVLLESQACGTPVVTYASGGTPEMVDAGSSGLVVPERDVDSLGDAIRSILTLGTNANRAMRSAARSFVVAERSFSRSCSELLEHYAAVAS